MDRTSLTRRLIHYQSSIEKLSGYLLKAKHQLINGDIAAYQKTTQAAAWEAEKLTRSLRDLTFQTACSSKKDAMLRAADALQIAIVQEERWVKITLPALLPHRKEGQSSAFLVDPLRYALTDFVKADEIHPLERGAVCVRYLYREDYPERWYRDHDNIECKQVLDAVLDKLLVDDTGSRCLNLYQTAKSPQEATEIFVMPVENLTEWVKVYVGQGADDLQKQASEF